MQTRHFAFAMRRFESRSDRGQHALNVRSCLGSNLLDISLNSDGSDNGPISVLYDFSHRFKISWSRVVHIARLSGQSINLFKFGRVAECVEVREKTCK